MNICVNAVEAMPDSGALTIRTRTLDPQWVEVQVEDTGVGMSSEVLEHALDPFFTTKEVGKGTGLGLSLAYRTVKAHQGEMDIQSVPGRGTCVTLRFPACNPGPQAAKALEDAQTRPGKVDLNILVVDDDELIQIAMQGMLEAMGHSVAFARDGEQALGMLDPPPDGVILDMNMPGLGGAATLLRLRARHPSLPVILATGRVDQSVLDLVAADSNVTLLPKPFDFGALRQAIGQAHRAAL
jgi:CheY-like chemotaxis protein